MTSVEAKTCARRPHPDRCGTCPAMQWPPGGTSVPEMKRWVASSRCPHDFQGGPVEWEEN